MATASGAQTLILFVAMALVTIWFTNVILKALDVLYKPRVKQWLGNRPAFGLDENEHFCSVEAPGCNEHATSNSRSSDHVTDEAIRQLEEELMVLKSLRGGAFKPGRNPKRKTQQSKRPENDSGDDLPDLAAIKRRPSAKSTIDRKELAPDELYVIDTFAVGQSFKQGLEKGTLLDESPEDGYNSAVISQNEVGKKMDERVLSDSKALRGDNIEITGNDDSGSSIGGSTRRLNMRDEF